MAALPGFHAWSEADVTGNFALKGKLEYWKVLLEADEQCLTTLADLGSHSRHVLCEREASLST